MSDTAPDGVLVVDKASGWTSHDVVARARRMARTRKVGHAGTLDPMATGVLLLGIGRATRMLGHLALTTKAYDATIRLGQTTITDDAEGDVVESRDTAAVADEAVAEAIARLTGDIRQVPSTVSAIKIDGKRSYARVRSGEDVDLPSRPVTVSAFTVAGVLRQDGFVDLDVHVECSTGTYVRALARDLGAALDVGGHLTALRRTRVGSFTLDAAHTLEQLEDLDVDSAVVSLTAVAAATFTTYAVDAEHATAVRNGRALDVQMSTGSAAADEPVAVLGPDGEFLALYRQVGDQATAIAVFAPA